MSTQNEQSPNAGGAQASAGEIQPLSMEAFVGLEQAKAQSKAAEQNPKEGTEGKEAKPKAKADEGKDAEKPKEIEKADDGVDDDGNPIVDDDDEKEIEEGANDEANEIAFEEIPTEHRLDAVKQIYDLLTDDEKREFATGTGSKLGKEMSKLRERTRQAEEAKATAEKAAQQAVEKIISPNNPFASIDTHEALKEEQEKIGKNLDFLDGLMDSAEVEFEIEGKEYTREQVRQYRNYWRNRSQQAKDHEYRLSDIRRNKEKLDRSLQKVKESYEWYSETESDERKEFDRLMNHPEIELIKRIAPSAAAVLVEVFAQNASGGKKQEREKGKIKLTLKPKNKAASGGIAAGAGTGIGSKGAAEMGKKLFSGEASSEDVLNMFAAAEASKR